MAEQQEDRQLLLVEDDPADAQLVADLLTESEGPGYTIHHHARLETALAHANEAAFDAVLLDLGLPDSQGLETVRAFQRGTGALPVVVLTGQENRELGTQAIQLGIQDFLPKGGLAPDLLDRILDYAINRHRSQRELRLLAAAFESGQAILITDADGTIQRVNDAFTTITGYAADEVVGKTPRVLSSGHHGPAFYEELWRCLATEGHWEGEIWNRRKDGEVFPEWEAITAVRDEWGKVAHYVAVFHEISEQKRLEGELERLATHDHLTGIHNRAKLYELLETARAEHERYGTPFAVVMFDIDHFKAVNDQFGHGVGDAILRELCQRVEAILRETDDFGRWGGEEFLLLAKQTDRAGAMELAERVRRSVAETPFTEAGQVTVSLGVAEIAPDEALESLEERADAALYQAKEEGRNRYAVG
ncbi:MAG TPA: diguanylate cyclase [Gammaproteobacteria bacterium]|nr:diguanylate cyclase [Gammaproteobacteria bacterium]